MAQCIKGSGNYLHPRNRCCICGIEDRKSGGFCRHACLDHLLFICDDCSAVHLSPRPGSCDNGSHGQNVCRELVICHLHLPQVFVCLRLSCHNLAAVNNRTAAYCKNKVYLVFFRQLRTFLYFCISGIRHDTVEIEHFLSCVLEDLFHFIINPVLFY